MFTKNLADELQVWGFEDDFVIFSDASLGFGLELSSVDNSCWDDPQSESLSERLKHFLNGLPSGIDLQFVLDIGRGNDVVLQKHTELAQGDVEIATQLAVARKERYLDYENRGLLPKYRLRLFVRRANTTALVTIGTLDQEKELSKLQTQRRLAFSMVKGKSGVSDIESESKYQDLESLLEGMIAGGEKVFRMSLQVLLRSTSVDVLDKAASETLIRIRELSGAEGMEETIAAFDVFSELGLPNSRAVERGKWLETSNLANFIPIFAPWPGHEKPSILLRSRFGSLLGLDPFAKDLPNFNHIVTGGSGAGKSFLTNLLLLQMLKEK